MKLTRCDASFAQQILAIFNDSILHSTALYDYKPRTLDSMELWFEIKRKGNFPVIGIVTESGELLGFASYGTFRAWPAYKYSVEHSVYVAAEHRGKGLGRRLLEQLIQYSRVVLCLHIFANLAAPVHFTLPQTKDSNSVADVGMRIRLLFPTMAQPDLFAITTLNLAQPHV